MKKRLAESFAPARKVIPPFPNNIQRESFGWYISGFTDGEGCFCLLVDKSGSSKQPYPGASFGINLRMDDIGILKLMQSYFQCGTLRETISTRTTATLRFRNLSDLHVIVNHFDEFNLFAKKRLDYETWREGVMLILEISKREQRYGFTYKWSEHEYKQFLSLKNKLEETRKLKLGDA